MISDYLAVKILDHLLGKTAFTAASPLHAALFTVSPTSAGTGGTEVTGGGYTRASITNNVTNFPAASAGSGGSGGTKSNGTIINFATATLDWGTVVGIGLYDAASGGNLYFYAQFSVSKIVNATDQPSFPIGELDFAAY